jgi:hypothetical protein
MRHPALKMPPTTNGIGERRWSAFRILPRNKWATMSKNTDAVLSVSEDPRSPADQPDRRSCLGLASGHLTADHPHPMAERHPVHPNSFAVACSGNPNAPITKTFAVNADTWLRIGVRIRHITSRQRRVVRRPTQYLGPLVMIRIVLASQFDIAPGAMAAILGNFVTQPLAVIEWVIGRHLLISP